MVDEIEQQNRQPLFRQLRAIPKTSDRPAGRLTPANNSTTHIDPRRRKAPTDYTHLSINPKAGLKEATSLARASYVAPHVRREPKPSVKLPPVDGVSGLGRDVSNMHAFSAGSTMHATITGATRRRGGSQDYNSTTLNSSTATTTIRAHQKKVWSLPAADVRDARRELVERKRELWTRENAMMSGSMGQQREAATTSMASTLSSTI